MDAPIVVGTDGSDTAMLAVTEAIRFAQAFGRPLHIVSGYHALAVSGRGLPAEFAGSVSPVSKVEAVLADAAARARSASVSVETHAVEGDPAEAIIDLAEKLGAGMIVIGNKGIGSARRFVLGNVPSKVVHHSPCSTYIVHTT
jgi:nucleotide-binding universal stress UspA family protein